MVKKKLSALPNALLPAILLLENNAAVVLTGIENGEAKLIFPESGHGTGTMSVSELEQHYTGYAVLARPSYEFEGRASFSEEKKSKSSWFWGTLWRFRSFYGRMAIATVVVNLLALTSSIFVMNVYDRVVPNQATETLYVLAIGAFIAFGFEFLLKGLRAFFVDRAGHRIDVIMGSALFEQVLNIRYGSRPESAGALASQARAYENLKEFFTSATVAAIVDVPFVFLFVGVVYMLGGIVAIPMLVGIFLCLGIGLIMQIPLGRAVASSYQASNQRHALFVEAVNSMETVKASRAEGFLQTKMEQSVNVSARADGQAKWYSQLAINLTGFVQHMVSMAIVMVAFYQIIGENMTMGAMIACVILAGRGMAPIAVLSSLLTRFQQSRRSLKGLNEIMALPSDQDGSSAPSSLAEFEPSVKVSGVGFTYPGESNQAAVQSLDLTIEPGERVALLGKIGSGKSTIIRMLAGLYAPSTGRIEISGLDINQMAAAELRKNVGYATQDCTLFYGTLRSNLTIGDPFASNEDIWWSLETAGLADFVKGHPQGLDMPVSEGGSSLSGGQRQAICLARSLMSRPGLLLLDEPTSAMDPGTERQFTTAFKDYLVKSGNHTLIAATHRASLLPLVERVIVLDSGRIVADGPRDEVIQSLNGVSPSESTTARSAA